MKICIKCRKSKDYSQFYKDKTRKDGYQNTCTPCRREQKGIIKREIEREIERKKAFYKKEKQREFDSHWSKFRANWTACEIYKNWAKKRHLKQTLKWGKKNPKKRKEIAKKYKENNKDKIKESRRIWIKNNREKYLKSKRIRNKEYRKKKNNDPMFIAIKRIRDRLQRSFKSRKWQKRSKTEQMLGCSKEMLVKHIESQFVHGMSWENKNEWHIDHIVPLCSAKTIEDLEKLSHFSNLRPLWANENMAKSGRIIECQPELILKFK